MWKSFKEFPSTTWVAWFPHFLPRSETNLPRAPLARSQRIPCLWNVIFQFLKTVVQLNNIDNIKYNTSFLRKLLIIYIYQKDELANREYTHEPWTLHLMFSKTNHLFYLPASACVELQQWLYYLFYLTNFAGEFK
jgi:hypothetical protein